jgi:uncharacterized protein (TIGR02722 family)
MKYNKCMTVLCVAPLLGLLAGGCATDVQYGDATAITSISTDFSSTDLQMIAGSMVDSLLTFPPIVEVTAARRPIIVVDKVKNKTMQHIDMESVTDTIKTKLTKSGKFRFMNRSTDQATAAEIEKQQTGGLTNPDKAVQFGQQEAPEFILYANFSEIVQKNDKVKDVYYKFTMSLKNLKTGIEEWTDEKEIRKQQQRKMFGG